MPNDPLLDGVFKAQFKEAGITEPYRLDAHGEGLVVAAVHNPGEMRAGTCAIDIEVSDDENGGWKQLAHLKMEGGVISTDFAAFHYMWKWVRARCEHLSDGASADFTMTIGGYAYSGGAS